MREKGVIRCKSKYLSAFLVIVMLIGMMTFSSGTAEAWEAKIFVDPQEVEAGDEVIFNVEIENTGANSMKVWDVLLSFDWMEGEAHSSLEEEIVISSGSSYEFTIYAEIPTGVLTDYNHDADIIIDASDPDYNDEWGGDWQPPERKISSDQIRVIEPTEEDTSDTDDEGFGILPIGLILIVIGAIILVLVFALPGEEEEEGKDSSQPQQQYQQAGQQQSQQQAPVPPPTQQSSQQPGGQQQPQQSQQSPAPPSPKNCPSCNAEMRYVDEHESWWCDSCQEYK